MYTHARTQYTCTHTCTHMYTCTQLHVHTCIMQYTYAHGHTGIPLHMHTHVHTHIQTCRDTYTYMHTPTHTCTHTHMCTVPHAYLAKFHVGLKSITDLFQWAPQGGDGCWGEPCVGAADADGKQPRPQPVSTLRPHRYQHLFLTVLSTRPRILALGGVLSSPCSSCSPTSFFIPLLSAINKLSDFM